MQLLGYSVTCLPKFSTFLPVFPSVFLTSFHFFRFFSFILLILLIFPVGCHKMSVATMMIVRLLRKRRVGLFLLNGSIVRGAQHGNGRQVTRRALLRLEKT